jgi:hypothetical protein
MSARALSVLVVLVLALTPLAAQQGVPVLAVDVRQASDAQHLLAVSLQGIANRQRGGPRVFLVTGPRDEEWLQYALRMSPGETQWVTVEQLLEKIRPELKGQVLYDPQEPYTINVATTLAGLRDAAITDADLGLPTVLDLRGRWKSGSEAYAWAASTLLAECDRDSAALMSPELLAARDLAIRDKMFTLAAPAPGEESGFEEILSRLAPGAALYGNAPAAAVSILSRASHYFVPASRAANMSFLSGIDSGHPFYQYVAAVETGAPRYLALIFDCADIGVALNTMPALWERWTRGFLPLGWALPAALSQTAPAALHRYYADQYQSGVDSFLLGPNGAGQMDLTAAGAPFTFFRATGRAADALDAHAAVIVPPPQLSDLGPMVSRLAAETGIRGAYVFSPPDFEPLLYDGVPVVPAPRVSSVDAAITYLDRIPLDRRFAALVLDPTTLTVADAAHVAARVARRYVVVTPEQLLDLMRLPAQPAQSAQGGPAITSVQYPEQVDPSAPIPVNAVIESPAALASAAVIFRPALSSQTYYVFMHATDQGYQAQVPPVRCGGEVSMSIRAIDATGRISWSPAWTIQIPRVDTDNDGLSDAEESFLLTDPRNPDTDGDGLLDGNDPTPLRFDSIAANYTGPVVPPSDAPYLPEPGGTTADQQGHRVQPGQTCMYWLPLSEAPVGAPVVIGVDAGGPAAIASSIDGTTYSQQFSGDLTEIWYSPPMASVPGGLFVRVSCPAGAAGPLVVRAIGAFSQPGAPSIGGAVAYPAHPGPGQPITVSAVAFSPKKVADVSLTYRVNGRGEITIPMQPIGSSQRYQASLPELDNRDELEWWITARDGSGAASVTTPSFAAIGSRVRESVSLSSMREFVGNWSASGDWGGLGREASTAGLQETAPANLTGGQYAVWILGGGRGQGIGVYVGDRRVGGIDPDKPDGWQQVGRVSLDSGRQLVRVVSETNPRGPAGAAPRYAEVILSADSTFRPPASDVVDIYNSLVLLSPRGGETISGRVNLLATGAGNVTAVEFSLDGKILRRVTGPPFEFPLATERVANGPHTLKVAGFDRTGSTGLDLSIAVTVAN